MINLLFEDLSKFKNFIDYHDELEVVRYRPSAICNSMKNLRAYTTLEQCHDINTTDVEHGIIPVGVVRDPTYWAGADYYKDNIKESIFDSLTPLMLDKIRNKKALILFDQCLEGYQTPWLWQFFHEECVRINIDPSSVVYVTGNIISRDQYQMWANSRTNANRIKVIPYIHFEKDIQRIAQDSDLSVSFDENFTYKVSNLPIIKTYNCLNKRPRPHRCWLYLQLFKEQLLDFGLVSMNDYGKHVARLENRFVDYDLATKARSRLPLLVYNKPNNEETDQFYINRITDQVFLDSWVTVISEASFADQDETIFISEKTFKPIACMHPFIIFGNKHSLQKLRSLGYKTFDGFIDESYDSMSTFDRMDAIVKEIKRINMIKDKAAWFASMRGILEHNYQVLHNSKNKVNSAHGELATYYKEYFNIKD